MGLYFRGGGGGGGIGLGLGFMGKWVEDILRLVSYTKMGGSRPWRCGGLTGLTRRLS